MLFTFFFFLIRGLYGIPSPPLALFVVMLSKAHLISHSRISGSRPGAVAQRTYPTPEARGCSREEQPPLQAAVAARVQEGLEELFHVQGQEGWQ